MVVDTNVGFTQDLTLQLSALGSLGWEAIGYTCIVQIGPNIASVLLKRQAAVFPQPADPVSAAWYPDPSNRFEQRHWDGSRWTQHVSKAGVSSVDYPNVR